MPFRQFLAKLDDGYVISKLAGARAEVFDGEASMREAYKVVLVARRHREVTRGQARELWDDLTGVDGARSSGDFFVHHLLGLTGDTGLFEEPWHLIHIRTEPGIAGFMRDLWPVFIARIKAELSPLVVIRSITCRCQADRDGDCSWDGCPQLRDGEPAATGRVCPLIVHYEEEA